MSRIKFISVCVILLVPYVLQGQNTQHLFRLYENKQFDALKNELDQFTARPNETAELTFFRTLFLEDGDVAVKIYETLSEKATGSLTYYVRQKLAEYYYARGFYVKASEWKSSMGVPPNNVQTLSDSKSMYKIQVGAFRFKENATKVQNYLASKNIQSDIIKRSVDGKDLFCVWIDGEDSRDQTEEYAKGLKSQFRLNYQIIEP